ncbi:MAG: M23 family metallopeptidase [Nocardioides sp.]
MGDHRAARSGSRRSSSVTPRQSTPTPVLVEQVTHGPGKRRAARPAPGRPLARLLPSVPVLAGVATVAIAAIGALSVVQAPAPAATAQPSVAFAPASALSGSSASSSSSLLARRGQQVSRDSSREALADAVDQDLVAEAEAQAKQRDAALAEFAKKAEAQAVKIALNAWVLPLDSYSLSAGFGAASYLWSNLHTGQDFAAPSGTSIHSIANGVVTETGYDGSYGNKTVVTLDDGTEIWYCHQTTILVSVGDTVRGGETIGTVGSTGNSTGPHLHLEVRPGAGDPVDPMGAFLVHGLTI